MERLQLVDGAVRAGNDLAVGVAPEEQLAHHPLFPLKRRHPVVGLVVQQFVEVLVFGDLLAAAGEAAVEVHRQAGDRLRQHPDAGEDGTAFQARLGADGNAGRRPSGVTNLFKDSGQIAPVLDDFKDCFVGLIHLQNTMSIGSSGSFLASPEAMPKAMIKATGPSTRDVELLCFFVGFRFPASSCLT